MRPLRVRVDLRIMAKKRYFTHSRSPEQEPHHQMQFRIIPRSPLFLEVGGLSPPTGKNTVGVIPRVPAMNYITDIFMFQNFFCSLAICDYSSRFFHFLLVFILGSAETVMSGISQVFFYSSIKSRSRLLAQIRWSIFIHIRAASTIWWWWWWWFLF